MHAASLVGFAAVFVLVAWATSLLARLSAAAIDANHRGPALERRLLEVGALAPLVIATSVVAILMGISLLGEDHCLDHHHHAHFCLIHGAPWAEQSWAVALVGFAAVVGAWRFARLVITAARNRRALSKLRAVAMYEDGIHWLPTPEPICFVTRNAEIFVSRGAWDALDPQERRAMVEHERAHIAHRDVIRRFVLDVATSFIGPWMSLRARWDAVTERLCDARAAATIGDHESVASALVKLARLQRSTTVQMLGFTPRHDAVSSRVHAILAEPPLDDRTVNIATSVVSALSVTLVAFLATHAALLHDVLEAICG
jgi:Zn-dependent protease with chaperone function